MVAQEPLVPIVVVRERNTDMRWLFDFTKGTILKLILKQFGQWILNSCLLEWLLTIFVAQRDSHPLWLVLTAALGRARVLCLELISISRSLKLIPWWSLWWQSRGNFNTLILFGEIIKSVDLQNRIPLFFKHTWLEVSWIVSAFIVDSWCCSCHVLLQSLNSLWRSHDEVAGVRWFRIRSIVRGLVGSSTLKHILDRVTCKVYLFLRISFIRCYTFMWSLYFHELTGW